MITITKDCYGHTERKIAIASVRSRDPIQGMVG